MSIARLADNLATFQNGDLWGFVVFIWTGTLGHERVVKSPQLMFMAPHVNRLDSSK
jgi:hypothetical protein